MIFVNKEFVKKMIKAERLRYEAFKEILPDSLRDKVDNFERDAVNFLKDIAIEIVSEDLGGNREGIKKETKKVEVDFS